MLILTKIIKFPKKEVIITQSSKIILAEMDFCGMVSPKKEMIDIPVLAGIMVWPEL